MNWDTLERLRLYAHGQGVPTARLVYENLDKHHDIFNNVTDSGYLLRDMTVEERRACSEAYIPEPEGALNKMHTKPLSEQITNWKQVKALLDNTRPSSSPAAPPKSHVGVMQSLDDPMPVATILDPAFSVTSEHSHPC